MRDSWQLAEGTILPLSTHCQVDLTAQSNIKIPAFTMEMLGSYGIHIFNVEHKSTEVVWEMMLLPSVKQAFVHFRQKSLTVLESGSARTSLALKKKMLQIDASSLTFI